MCDLGTIIPFAYLFVYFSVLNVNCPASLTQNKVVPSIRGRSNITKEGQLVMSCGKHGRNVSADLEQAVDPGFQNMILPT